MKAVLDVINQLQKVIEKQLEYTEDFSVVLDYPEETKVKKSTTIFIVPDGGALENLTTGSDVCYLDCSLYVICKRKNSDTLMLNVFNCFEALYKLLRGNSSLDGYVSDCTVLNFDYYPQTETESQKAIEVQMQIQWEKDF